MTQTLPSPERIMQVGMGFEASKTLLSAVELGLFTELAKAPADEATLRTRLGLHPRGSRDFLDTLVALGFLSRVDGVYHNSAESAAYLDRAKPAYRQLGGLLEMANGRLYGIWGNLTEALRTGVSQDESKSSDLDTFDALYADPTRLKQFLVSMTAISHAANQQIAKLPLWKDHSTFADMGSAQGDLAVQVLLAHEHLTGIGFDLPATGPILTEYAQENGVGDRLTFAGGDFFVDDFPRADVITFGHILHNWDLAKKKILLRKAWEALPAGGTVVVYDSLIDDERKENAFALMMSLTMLSVTEGGAGYTGAECEGWLAEVGFKDIRTDRISDADSIVVGTK